MKHKSKVLRRIVSFVSVLVLSVNACVFPVFARSGEKPGSVDEAACKEACDDDWRTYTQTDPRWGAQHLSDRIVYDFGCQATAEAALMKATGQMPADWNPLVFFKWCHSVNSYAGVSSYPDSPFDTVYKYQAYDEKKCKEALDNGLYVELRCGGATNGDWGGYDGLCGTGFHSVFVVGYDDNGIIFGETWDGWDRYADFDSDEDRAAGKNRKFKKIYVGQKVEGDPNGGVLKPGGMRFMECKKSAFNNEKALAGETSGGSSKSKNKSAGGTPMSASQMKWVEEQHFLEDTGSLLRDIPENVQVPGIEWLSVDYQKAVRDWSDDVESKHMSATQILRAVVMLVGILMALYSALLYVAYQFDDNQNFIDVQFLPILTLGHLQNAPSQDKSTFTTGKDGIEKEKGKKKFVTHKDIIIISLIGIAIGVLLISGYIFLIISNALRFIREVLLGD